MSNLWPDGGGGGFGRDGGPGGGPGGCQKRKKPRAGWPGLLTQKLPKRSSARSAAWVCA